MALTQPSTAQAGAGVETAPVPPERPRTEPRRWAVALLAALGVVCAYAAFAGGATGRTDEARVQVVLAALALGATVLWAGERLDAPAASRSARIAIVLLIAFAAWSGLSLLWSVAPDRTWLEANRALTYALVAVLGLVAGTSARRGLEAAALGLLGLSVAVGLYALQGKVLPGLNDTTATVARLRAPLDYWNALALVLVLGVPIALRLTTDLTRGLRVRAVGLASCIVLLAAIGMTYSRGAVVALVVAVVVLTALGGPRLRGLLVLVVALLAAAPVLAFAFTSDALTTNGAPLADRISDGRLLGAIVLACVAAGLAAGWGLARIEARGPWPPARQRLAWRVITGVGVLALLAAVVALAVSSRGFSGSISHAASSFTRVKQDRQFDPVRLISTNSGNRWVWWREAVGAWSDKPAGGWGAGSFGVTHLRYRTNDLAVAQPHSVPLQFLAETGAVGAVLALAGLGLLLAAGLGRVRRLPAGRQRDLGAAGLAAVSAWLVHGLYDWDWDIPGVTLPVLALAGVLAAVTGTRGRPDAGTVVDPARPRRSLPRRLGLVAAAALAFVAFAVSAVLPAWSDSKAAGALTAVGADTASPQDLQAAAAQADLAARMDPLATGPRIAGSAIAIRRTRTLEARALLLDAVRRQPEDVTSWAKLASVAFLLADRDGFERAALRALQLDPHNPALRQLALRAIAFGAPPAASATATGTPLAPAAVPALTPAPAVAPAPTAPGG